MCRHERNLLGRKLPFVSSPRGWLQSSSVDFVFGVLRLCFHDALPLYALRVLLLLSITTLSAALYMALCIEPRGQRPGGWFNRTANGQLARRAGRSLSEAPI
ncbi:hypothetical protein Tsp_01158 [Trichinella spiralis]|uniref:Uncharacterized protein n=1 Tax=Trichinella spiralis TaxID=6334 RepID=E5SBN3_TRISP|nr:hypothetical protein Tsp_01158 [Trichinella spiralis]KRY37296.1 hypothetical protein T01_5554 [Trichinella spiralis]